MLQGADITDMIIFIFSVLQGTDITDLIIFIFSALQGADAMNHHPGPAIATLMKLSFDEEHRHAICTLGNYHYHYHLIMNMTWTWLMDRPNDIVFQEVMGLISTRSATFFHGDSIMKYFLRSFSPFS